MKLNDADRANPLMLKLVDGWRDELGSLRAQNDAPHDPIKTAEIRGRIAHIKQCIALIEAPDTDD